MLFVALVRLQVLRLDIEINLVNDGDKAFRKREVVDTVAQVLSNFARYLTGAGNYLLKVVTLMSRSMRYWLYYNAWQQYN